MEAENQTDDAAEHAHNKPLDVPPNPKVDSGIDIAGNINDPKDNHASSKEKSKWTEYKNKWKEPLVIVTIILVAVTGILAYYTYALFNEAADSSRVARDAVAEARRANERAERKDVQDSIESARKDSISAVRDRMNYDLSKKSLNAEVSSVEETQKQFIATNQPFLQVTDIALSRLEVGKPIEITYEVKNINEVPALIVGYSSVNTIRIQQPRFKEMRAKLKVDKDFKSVNMIVTKEIPYQTKTELEQFSANQAYWIDRQKASIYFASEIRYINLITNKYRRYLFYVELKRITGNTIFPHNTYVKLLETSNYDEPLLYEY